MAEPVQTRAADKTSGGNAAYHNFHNDFLQSVWPSPSILFIKPLSHFLGG